MNVAILRSMVTYKISWSVSNCRSRSWSLCRSLSRSKSRCRSGSWSGCVSMYWSWSFSRSSSGSMYWSGSRSSPILSRIFPIR